MPAAVANATFAGRIEKLIYGNVKQSDKLIECIKAWMLAPVLYVHDGTRSTVYKLCEVFLRPALCLSFSLDLFAQRMEVEPFCVLVHFYITPILFYISGDFI